MTESGMWEFPHARALPRGVKTLVMGIVNMTPDSFSGRNSAGGVREAVELALDMFETGADVVDIGAESSRPGAKALGWREESARLGDVVGELRERTDGVISVDTYHAETAERALSQGADMINDITALRGGWDAGDWDAAAMGELAAGSGAHVVLMHMPSSSAEMWAAPEYGDVVGEVRDFLVGRAEFALRCGVKGERIWLDPGFGFGKDFRHNRELLLGLSGFAEMGFAGVLAGMSRKRMVGEALGVGLEGRLEGSLALAVMAGLSGAAMVRVHDVLETARALRMADAIRLGSCACCSQKEKE